MFSLVRTRTQMQPQCVEIEFAFSFSPPWIWLRKWPKHVVDYLLTPWRRDLLEKLTGSAGSREIPRNFGTRMFITVLRSARHLSLSWANSIQSPQPPPHFLKIHLNIILPSASGSPQWFFPSGFPTRTLYTPLPCPIRATCIAHLIVVDYSELKLHSYIQVHLFVFIKKIVHVIHARNMEHTKPVNKFSFSWHKLKLSGFSGTHTSSRCSGTVSVITVTHSHGSKLAALPGQDCHSAAVDSGLSPY